MDGLRPSTLCVFLCSWISFSAGIPGPHYMVAIPAVLESGTEPRFCASLLRPNETLTMTVHLLVPEEKVLMEKTSSVDFHECFTFQVPVVQNEAVFRFQVTVHGQTFNSIEVRKVKAKVYEPTTFIQTDKPLYLPGQTVHFRVVTLDAQLRPHSRTYDVIEVEDTHDNVVAQWINATANNHILQLSYALNSEAREGLYQVVATHQGNKKYHNFNVEKYVLPKFDVKVKTPNSVSVAQDEFTVDVCAKYTFGQSVPGSVKISTCRPLNRYYHGDMLTDIHDIKPVCHGETKEIDKNGCAAFTLHLSTFSKLDKKIVQDQLDVRAEVEEEGTGVSRAQGSVITISHVIGRLSFIDMPKVYEKGANIEGKVKAVHYNDTPVTDFNLYLFEGQMWSAHRLLNLTTNTEGVASFSFSSLNMSGDIHLYVGTGPILEYPGYRTPHFEHADLVVSLAQDQTAHLKPVSSVQIQSSDQKLLCDQEAELKIKYTVVGENPGPADLMYLVLSRGAIVTSGFEKVQVQDQRVTEGQVSFKLMVQAKMAPAIQVLAYMVLPSENVIAHNTDFSTQKCFSHKVSLDFVQASAVPGEETTMTVQAQPDSVCGVSAVDQSVLIQKPGKTLNEEKIFSMLPVRRINHVPYDVQDSEQCLHVRSRRYILPYPGEGDDAHTIFQNIGVKMATNLFVKMPSCLKFRGREYHRGSGIGYYDMVPSVARMETRVAMASPGIAGAGGVRLGGLGGTEGPPPIETVRTFFPETWLWDLVEVGDSGKKDVALTVPDTITTWETEAFCLSPQGFGLAPRRNLKVFQPFFLELTLPYSIIRGEKFELKATTFNYLSNCIMVNVSPKPSPDYTLTPLSGDQYTSCLCGRERKTLRWNMDVSALGVMNVTVSAEAVASHVSCNNDIVSVPERGRIDVVTRTLIVKAEGVEMSKTHNLLLCPKGGVLKDEVHLKLPENVIPGSARASVSVLGDILGRAMKNLDGLLRMPYGCGEQNIALLAPNIYILHYLKNTGQLTPPILEKASTYLSSGYQRQLNYKHYDGAFSTFGTGVGNTWLTAFVVKSLQQANSFIHIDKKVQQEAKLWLISLQDENGSFRKSGELFNNRMKGGVSDEVTLTAYVTAAFLEMNVSQGDQDHTEAVQKGLTFLKNSTTDLSNTYATALMAYVFTLAGDLETRARLLKHLDSVAQEEGGFLHWSQDSAKTSASLSVEISSYVLLARLGSSPTTEDLGSSSRIVRWLSAQQNYYGGFSSTQDTVVALQALSLYSTLVFSPGGSASASVKVQSSGGGLTFDLNQNNKLVYQEKNLEAVEGKYGVEVTGDACAVIQFSVMYNVPTPKEPSDLHVEVKGESSCMGKDSRKLHLMLTSLYRGKEEKTNMVILDIKVASGFVPETESLKALRSALLVERVEQKEDHVLVYIEKLDKDIPIHHKLDLIQEQPVQNLKPAVVSIYDYYQPSDKAETEYTFPCAAA